MTVPLAPKHITALEIEEVSMVDYPANVGARVLLLKAAAPVDALDAQFAKAMAHVSAGEIQQAVQLVKSGVACPRSFWKGHLDGLAKSLATRGTTPATAAHLALQHADGQALLAALIKAP